MDFIGVAVLLHFVFHVEKGAESKNEVVAIAGCNVSLEWTLVNKSIGTISTEIFDSSGKKISHLTGLECNVVDNSSTYCIASNHTNESIMSLTILNVTARQSGNYTMKLKQGLVEEENISKKLVVIEKPKIMESWRPIIGQPFEMTCNSLCGLEFCVYRWRINGRDITPLSNVSAHSISSLLMTDNLSNVTCQVCFNERARNFSGKICKQDACSADSDPYIIQVIYGPDNISLSLNKSNFYLEEHANFTIDCSAHCNPNCTFWWKGHDTIGSNKLVIANVESKMAGNYTCYAKNQERNITSQSNPITLHVQEDKDKEEGMEGNVPTGDNDKEAGVEVIGMGLVGVAVLLAIIGIVLVIQWRKNASNKTDPQTLNEPVVNLRTATNREMSQGNSRIQNRPLPIPNTQETTNRRPYRPKYPNHKRKSRSLHNLLDSAQDSFYPLRGDLSLQLLYSPSNVMDRSHRNGTQDYDSIKGRCFSNCEENQLGDMSRLENGIKLEYLYAKVRKDKKANRDEHNARANSESLKNLRHESFEHESQENLYSTIDEDALSVYDDAKNNSTNENSNEEQMNTRHGESNFDYADLPLL